MREDDQALPQAENGGGGISLGYLLSVMRERVLLIIVMVALATSIASGFGWYLPNRFDASTTVQIDPRRKTVSNMEGVVSDLKADQTTVESEVEVIRSK